MILIPLVAACSPISDTLPPLLVKVYPPTFKLTLGMVENFYS